jgi:predicted GH43/DUF377 family glycosyl hydrolase
VFISLLHVLPQRLHADARRVVVRPFHLQWQAQGAEPSRAKRLLDRVLVMTKDEVTDELARVFYHFDARHWQVEKVFDQRYTQFREQMGDLLSHEKLTPRRRQLLGAYLCHEYSYAAAAIMNPSVVAAPDQSGMIEGAVRFVMSMRTVGEGHISSIAFAQGVVGPKRNVDLWPTAYLATAADVSAIKRGEPVARDAPLTIYRHPDCDLGRTVIFPMTETQRGGLEDLRITPFVNGTGKAEWIGTYTAYDGRSIRSELMRTKDFRRFELVPMTGNAARNKGMALFPRKIGGQYMMIGRQDGENLFLLTSESLTDWEEGLLLARPEHPWEFVQIGNCGPPIELDEGWLVLTHGVGAMRRYSIGAILLDKDDPSKVIGRTRRPLLEPLDEERDGYVPNVVYTCGAMRVGDDLFMPFGIADSSIGFAFAAIPELLASLR